MRRVVAGLVLVLTACAGGSADPETPSTTAAAAGGEDAGVGTTTATSTSTTAPRADPTAPVAPDFSLVLVEGGEFVLSAEQKPVYLVFWAEW